MGIIKSILDLDFYKITMLNAVILKYPNHKVKYKFNDRSNRIYPKGFAKKVRKELQSLAKIRMADAEANFLIEKAPWLSPVTIKFLKGFSFDPSEVNVYQDEKGHLIIEIEGYWHSTILWETMLMSIISELFFKKKVDLKEVFNLAAKKSLHFRSFNQEVVEMGTRRRRSYAVQDAVIRGLFKSSHTHRMIGTSNVHFGMKYDLRIIGTVAHEWYMFHSALYGYSMANLTANDTWSDVYRGELGIALPDTFTTDNFLESFDGLHAKLYDGIRQDSGDEIEFFEKFKVHYHKLGIDPKTKSFVFSNGLNGTKIDKVHQQLPDDYKKSYGVGTWLTNDFGDEALNIVIKMSAVEVNGKWVNVVKLSDDPGKHAGKESEIYKAKLVLGIGQQPTLFD